MPESTPRREQPRRRRAITLPALRLDITLNTDFAQRVYKRVWDRLKADIFILTVRSRAVGRDDIAETSEQLLDDQFLKVRTDLSADMSRTDHLMDQLAITELGQYAAAAPIAAEWTTPQAKQYLDLLLSMDQLVMRLEALWLHGEIDTKACKVRCYEWQRRLIKLANRIRQVSSTGRKTIDDAFAARQQARAAGAQSSTAAEADAPQTDTANEETPAEAVPTVLDVESVSDDDLPAPEDDAEEIAETPASAASG